VKTYWSLAMFEGVVSLLMGCLATKPMRAQLWGKTDWVGLCSKDY
jgi:hypothetical protein